MKPQSDVNDLVEKISKSRKYRNTGIPRKTIEDVLNQELARFAKEGDALKSARAILHNVMAPYLGDPDYEAEEKRLEAHCASEDKKDLDSFCREILMRHDSTRERMPYLEDFYKTINDIAQQPKVILDLACGLNPFALPFTGFPNNISFHAYDIHKPRVDLINSFFSCEGIAPLAEVRDVLLDPPQIAADAAFLFKEAHRMEKRRKGSSRDLVHSLNAKVIFISLPNRSLDGQRDLHQRMDALFQQISTGLECETDCLEFPGEKLYWIKRIDG
jgi:16S rRNA (guanine(1405)-N(7))-methyltransferase